MRSGKKPIRGKHAVAWGENCFAIYYFCPTCNADIGSYTISLKYEGMMDTQICCPNCGQKINWSENDGN